MEKSDLQRFRNECVAAHNFYRAAHGTPPICWSTKLAESAQSWAEQLARTTGSLRYSSEKGVGENLACLWGSELNGQKVTRIWYEEGQHFDYNKPRVSSRTRSFCQVVWEGTRELGAGAAVTEHGKQIVVARYYPSVNKKDVAKNVKKSRSTEDGEKPLAYDTRWSRLYVGLKEFHEECLAVHNEYRIRHGAAPLHWSAELAWEAQQWAENLARTGVLRHNDDDTVGENLAGMTGGELTGREAVDMWYEEIESYDFENPGYSEDTSNFTQIVWVASENLGVGKVIDGDLCVVVAFYEPPGNMEGSFGDNVLRMGSTVRQRKGKEPKGFEPPPPDLEGFRLECLVTHNYFRARHGSPPLVLSSALTDEAQYWAERLLVTGASEGLDNSRIGISVAILENKHVSGIKVSELWYKQILSYDFDRPGFSTETLDFSQLVWLTSRKLGVGRATGAEGVTVVVARYEPVGNIDGLFVQNVRRRGHERGSCEPMIFHVEYKCRVRADSKSTNSFLSWEHEEAPTLDSEGDITKSSDLDQFDENKNVLHRAEEQESVSALTVTDAFTRLVWIDPNSPTLQRKGMAEERIQEEADEGEADEEEEDRDTMEEDRREEEEDDRELEEDEDKEDARIAYEQDIRTESEDHNCVSEVPLLYTEHAELEEAELFSDPEDDLYQHIYEVRRSLSLDSSGTEPETQKGNVLSKVAFFETFQRSFEAQSPSNSESSFRRSLIQDELEELASRPKTQVVHEEEEQEQADHGEEEEEQECQLEFDDLFPAHREGDEAEAHMEEDMFEEEGGDDESLVSVSDTEDVLGLTDYDTRPEGVQDYEFEDNYSVSREFIEEEPSTLEIFDFSDEEASHQYADITDTEARPLSTTKRVLVPTRLGTASEFKKNEPFKTCEDEPPDLLEDAPENYSEELIQTGETNVEVPQTSFTSVSDPDHCFVTRKQQDVDTRMKNLISKIGLLPVEDSTESKELSDFNETIEGKLLQDVINSRKGQELKEKRTPIEEICEAVHKNNVESEIDFEALFARIENDRPESQEDGAIPQPSRETKGRESPDAVHVILRDYESERSVGMERISGDIELKSTEQSTEREPEERELTADITLSYECQSTIAVDDIEPVPECIEPVQREHKPESPMVVEELQVRMKSPAEDEPTQRQTTEKGSDVPTEEEFCEAVLRDCHRERARVLEEIGLVPVFPDISYSDDEPVEPLPYVTAATSTVSEAPEDTEHISAEVRRDVRCEIDFEELFRRIDEENAGLIKETADMQRFDVIQVGIDTSREEPCEPVLRDYDQERSRSLGERALELELVPVSSNVTQSLEDSVEPLPYDQTIKSSPDSRSPEISEHIGAEVRHDVRCEINFEELFRCLDEEDTKLADELSDAQSFEETETTVIEQSSRASVFVEEDRIVGEVLHCVPSSSEHISHESKNNIPDEEVVEVKQAEDKRPVSLYSEESTVVKEVTTERPSSPKHIVGEGVNLERTEVVVEVYYSKEEGSAVLVVDESQVVTEVHTEYLSSQHFAGEAENIEQFEEIEEKNLSNDDNRASLYMEEDQIIQEATPEVSSSPLHLANECENINLLEEEAEEIERRGEEKRGSLYVDENTIVESVILEEASLKPLHIAEENLNADPTTQIQEVETSEDEKRASLYFEEDISFAEVTCKTPLSPKHTAYESINTNYLEKVEHEELVEQEKRASLYWEDDVLVDEVTPDVPSSPKHIAGESVNTEFTEEVKEQTKDEKRTSVFVEEEATVNYVTSDIPSSPLHVAGENANNENVEEIYEEEFGELEKRASLFLEEDSLVEEVVPGTPSSPKHIAGETSYVVPFEEIDEEPTEESKKASLFLEEASVVNEVKTDAPSSPKHIAGESTTVEPFEEIDEEPTEERKRASLFLEEAPRVDEVTTDTPSSPQHIAGESSNVETFEEIDEEPTEESKRASLFLEETPLVDEVTTDALSSPKHIAGESSNIEPFEEIHEGPTEESKRASLFLEEAPLVDQVATDTPSSPKHIAGESSNVEPFEEIYEEPTEESKRASLLIEEVPLVDQVTTDTPSSPKHIAGESSNVEPFEEIYEEPTEESKRASLFLEEAPLVDQVTTDTPSSPKHIAGESSNVEPFEEVYEEPTEESKRASLFLEEAPLVDQVTTDTPSSPKHIAGESSNVEPFEEIYEEPTEESKRASLFLEEAPLVDQVTTDTPSSPKHIAGESSNVEPFEEVYEEPTEESKRASLFLKEAPLVDQVTTDTPSSPKHIAGESNNVEPFEEIDEEPTEESKRASLFLEEDATVGEVTTNTPCSPKHLAGESVNIENFEHVAVEPGDENKRTSVFLEEDLFVGEVATATSSSPIYITSEALSTQAVEEFYEEEAIPSKEHAQELEESDSEVRCGYVSLETPDQNNHIAEEVSNSDLLEVTDGDESPESDYGEHFQEFEGIYCTERFVESPQTAHIAGEVRNTDAHDEALEEDLQLEESLEYEDNHEMVTTTDLLETLQPSFHIAGELSNVEPREESSEEEKPEDEAFAEVFEETEVQASTAVLKSPQSLLSIAASALEHNIDAAQQDSTEEFTTETTIKQQYREEEHVDVKLVVSETLPSNAHLMHQFDDSKQHEETVEVKVTSDHLPPSYDESETAHVSVTNVDTEVPVILVNIAGESSDSEENNVVLVEDESQEHHEMETERDEVQEEAVSLYSTNEQPDSKSHVAAEVCVSESVLAEDETNEQRDYVEPFEESEEGSVSELLSECSSSPLHVSTELKDFQDYETINEEYGTETYHAIMYEEGDYVSEKPISKGLPSLFITEEFKPQEIYEENIINEQSAVIETVQEYSDIEEPLESQKIVDISQTPSQIAAELSDSDFNDGVEEEDELSEREFAEEFVDMEEIKGQTSLNESASLASEHAIARDPQIAEEEDELLDETDNAQKFEVQENLVILEQSTVDMSPVILAPVDERVIHKEEKIIEEVWEVEVKEGGQYVETIEEKHEASQIQKFMVASEKEQKSVKVESSYQVLESKGSFSASQTHRGESVFMDQNGRQLEISHEMEEKVEVLSTRTTRHVSSTTSHFATEYTSEGIQYQFTTNGACVSHQMESSDQLSESILDKEAKDQESEKFEKQLSEDETEVRLLKSEVMEYKAAERQAPLVSPSVTVERETTFVKTLVVQSAGKDDQEEVLMREDRVTAILKDDEASLEDESPGEQFEEEIDIMRMDEALSEEEFRGERAESIDRDPASSSKADSVEDIDESKEHEDSKVHEGDEKKSLYKEEVEIRGVEPFYEEEFEVKRARERVEEIAYETKESTVETSTFQEEVEVAAFEVSDEVAKENFEPAEETELRTQPPVFEEELEVSAFPKEDITVYEEYAEEDKPVDRSAVFEEELEVSAFTNQREPGKEEQAEEDKLVDQSAIFEEELEVSALNIQDKPVEEQDSEEKPAADQSAVFEEELEVSKYTRQEEPVKEHLTEDDKPGAQSAVLEEVEEELNVSMSTGIGEPVEEQNAEAEDQDAFLGEYEEGKAATDGKAMEETDEEESIEHVETETRRQPLDLSQVDLYDEEESATATRYYVELSSTESLEPAYEEVEGDETSFTETYVRQGEPLEENLEEFILVRYGDEYESSGEEDISDHREIYVIPEEENDIENNHAVEAPKGDDEKPAEPLPESFYEEGFENVGLEEIRESPEFDIDDSDELDEEEQRQLEEYERLESFVILEEKLSQVESDDDEIAYLQGEEGDENVFHSDVHSSSEETLHEDEFGETMTASSIRQAAVSTDTKQRETSMGDNCIQAEGKGSDERQETEERCSSGIEELTPQEELSQIKIAEGLSAEDNDRAQPTGTEDESLHEDPTDKKDEGELSREKDDKMEPILSSDSSGEQSMSSEGSLSSTTSVDLEGLDSFEQDCILQHNLYRRQHRVKPLKWSEELAEGARRWAEHLASVNSLETFEGKEVGENLTSVHGNVLNGSEAADLWYKEATDYNFEDPAFNAKCGRFTQVVWASSREFGVAKCVADDGTQYVVARYKPAGNIVGEFKENVKPPRDPSSRLKRRRSSARRRSRSEVPSTPAEKEKFKTECVISHNYYRTFHNAPALRWSPLLAAEAQNYAERLAKTDSLTHSGQKDRGENLAYTWDTPLSARGAIDMWYDEVQDYDFDNPGFTSDSGHFSQLVWVGTEEFGMGMAVAADGRNIVVGRYFPPGNIVGQFKENVRPREIEGIP